MANTTLGELRLVKAPSNLIELAYHDNAEDAFWIIDNIQLIARTLVLALTEYFGIPFVKPAFDVCKGSSGDFSVYICGSLWHDGL